MRRTSIGRLVGVRCFRHAAFALAAALLPLLFGPQAADAQSGRRRVEAKAGGIQDFTSQHFLIHTDLDAKEAAEQLKKLETMLKLVSTYWKRPTSGIIECYVAKNIKEWPEETLKKMDAGGIAKIEEGAGVCITRTMGNDTQFIAKSIVYAVAEGGVPQHEAVHAYCGQTFGRTGPQWYAEGMAELGNYWVEGKKGVNAHPGAIAFLQKYPPKSVGELISLKQTTGGTWQDYAKWWSLCHFLESNNNYNGLFRELGPLLLLGKSNQGFDQTFGGMADQLSFEYFFFMDHIKPGYRCDLTTWDWRRKFRPLHSTKTQISAQLQADRGWQPSGVTVKKGKTYEYAATGTWSTAKGKKAVSADGDDEGAGRLMGVLLMSEYKLGKEFELGAKGGFTAEADGDLYLRCRDKWEELGDNTGRMSLKFSLKEADHSAAEDDAGLEPVRNKGTRD